MNIIDPLTKMKIDLVPREMLSYLKEAERRHLQKDGVHWIENMGHVLEVIKMINPQSLLDFGCSAGHFLDIVPIENKVGFETDQYAVEKGRRKGLTIYDDWEKAPITECILAIDVIEHLKSDDVVQLFYNFHEKLKLNGHLILQTDNPRCIGSHLDFYNDYTHVRMYDSWTITNILNMVGFCTVKAFKVLPIVKDDKIQQLNSSMIPNYRDPFLKWVSALKKIM